METLIVVLIVLVAAVYVGRVFYNGFKQKNGCSSGCTCCSISDSCSQPPTGDTRDTSAGRVER